MPKGRLLMGTGPLSRGEITKNNKCGSILKEDNYMITCADRSTWMAGLIKLPHILGFKFILPRLLGPVWGNLEEVSSFSIYRILHNVCIHQQTVIDNYRLTNVHLNSLHGQFRSPSIQRIVMCIVNALISPIPWCHWSK